MTDEELQQTAEDCAAGASDVSARALARAVLRLLRWKQIATEEMSVNLGDFWGPTAILEEVERRLAKEGM